MIFQDRYIYVLTYFSGFRWCLHWSELFMDLWLWWKTCKGLWHSSQNIFYSFSNEKGSVTYLALWWGPLFITKLGPKNLSAVTTLSFSFEIHDSLHFPRDSLVQVWMCSAVEIFIGLSLIAKSKVIPSRWRLHVVIGPSSKAPRFSKKGF